ncbi:hypothetical protein DBR06_SOUSAS3810022, partial [Sousa chinensis]
MPSQGQIVVFVEGIPFILSFGNIRVITGTATGKAQSHRQLAVWTWGYREEVSRLPFKQESLEFRFNIFPNLQLCKDVLLIVNLQGNPMEFQHGY